MKQQKISLKKYPQLIQFYLTQLKDQNTTALIHFLTWAEDSKVEIRLEDFLIFLATCFLVVSAKISFLKELNLDDNREELKILTFT